MTTQSASSIAQPYPGLRPFGDLESTIFFGRDAQVKAIIERLRRHHCAAVMGGSGSGKSSIVRAGVIPKLRAYGITDRGDFWIPVTFTPRDAPITHLVDELEKILEPLPGAARDERRVRITRMLGYADGLATFLSGYHTELVVEPGLEDIRRHANLLLVVDQFEEIFRDVTRNSGQCRHLVDLLVGAFKHPDDHVYTIITLRTEDLHRCAAYLALPEVLNETMFLTRRLDEDELEQAIERPPRVIQRQRERECGREDRRSIVFDDELLAALYDDLAATRADNDHLPLLQHLLYRVWEHAPRKQGKAALPRHLSVHDLHAVTTNSRGATPDSGARTNNKKQLSLIRRLVNWVAVHTTDQGCDTEVSGAIASTGIENSLLARCLKTQADRIYAGLGRVKYRQDVARVMFQLLAYQDSAGNYTRRWTDREKIRELAAHTTGIGDYPKEFQMRIVGEVIKAFSEPHPYIREDPDADHKIDVSHEALIRNWPKFRTWLVDEREAINVYVQVDEQFREMQNECDGKPTVIRCFKRLNRRYMLSWRMLEKIKEHRILDRGKSWIKSYEGKSGSVVSKDSAKRFGEVGDYIRSSSRWSKGVRYGIAVVGIFAIVSFIGWFYQAYTTEEQRVRGELAEESREAFKREAQAFQPFAVGAQMEQPRDTWGAIQNQRYLFALWEGAVALKALEQKLPGFRIKYPGDSDGENENTSDQHLRWKRAVRLALGKVNQATHSLLGLPVWDLGSGAAAATGKPAELADVAQSGDGDPACRETLELSSSKTLYHQYHPGRGSTPGRGVYFDPDSERQFTFYSGSGSRCYSFSQRGEAPGSTLVYIDPELRYYVVRAQVPIEDTIQSLYTFVGLQWTPAPCKQGQQACEMSWRISSPGKVRLTYGSKDEPSIQFRSGRVLLIDGEESRSLVLTPALTTIVDDNLPMANDSRCDDRLKALGYTEYNACTASGSLLAVASWVAANQSRAKARDAGEQVIHILSDDLGLTNTHKGRNIVKLPISTLLFNGEKISGLSLSDNKSEVRGELWLQFESAAWLKTAWGGEPLRETACKVLRQLSREQRKQMRASPRHSLFFTVVANDKSIIKENNSLDCICGRGECIPQRGGEPAPGPTATTGSAKVGESGARSSASGAVIRVGSPRQG